MWSIVEQEERMDGVSIPVECKILRWRPGEDEETGEVRFFPIAPLAQVILRHDHGAEVRLKWSSRSSSYAIQEQDRLEYPTLRLGKGRVVPDTLSPKVCKPGERVTFAGRPSFYGAVAKRFGKAMADRVFVLLEERIGEIVP